MAVAYEWLLPKKAEYQQLREFAFFSQQNYLYSLEKIKEKKGDVDSQVRYILSLFGLKFLAIFIVQDTKKNITQNTKYKIDPQLQ